MLLPQLCSCVVSMCQVFCYSYSGTISEVMLHVMSASYNMVLCTLLPVQSTSAFFPKRCPINRRKFLFLYMFLLIAFMQLLYSFSEPGCLCLCSFYMSFPLSLPQMVDLVSNPCAPVTQHRHCISVARKTFINYPLITACQSLSSD